MPAVAGLRGTGDFSEDERPKNFRETILFRNPTGSAPIFALTSKARKRSTDDPEYAWWDEPNGNVRLQIAGTFAAGDTLLTVDSSDPSASSPTLQWGTALHLKAGDLLQVEKTEATAYDNEFVEVTAVISATQFMVRRGAAGSVAATINNDTFLTLMGSAYAEGTAAPAAVSRNPIKYFNYTQIFKDTYELSRTADKTNYRTGSAMSNDKRRKTWDHSRAIEWALLFGRRHETTGENGKPKRFMGGLREFIPSVRTTVFSTAVTVNTFLDAVYPAFDFETGAGDVRMCWCGNGALNNLNKVIQADANTDIQYNGVFKQYGMDFQEFILPQGRLMLRTHPLMNQHGRYTNSMFGLDFDSIRYVALRDSDTKIMDDVQAKDEDVRRGFYQTECGLQVDRGGTTMFYLGNILAS
jgi:hypothetical protein